MRLFLAAASLACGIASTCVFAGTATAAAPPADHPTCAAVRTAFTAGAFDDREAIVDGLQDRMKAEGADKPLGRDGKVQAIVMAVMRCDELGHGDYMAALDRSALQVETERARRRTRD